MTRVLAASSVVACATLALLAVCAGDAKEYHPPADSAAAAVDSSCALGAGGALPKELRETSGIAAGSNGIMWTHNDGGKPFLYALARDGRVTRRVRIDQVKLEDWEDIESGVCDGARCLYLADTGDNDGNRRSIAIHVVNEPADAAAATTVRTSLAARYPDGPQDAEALFVLPNGELFIVTKGRHGHAGLFRYPPPYRPGEIVTLVHVRPIAPLPRDTLDRVTAATASHDGQWVAVRTYRTLLLYPAAALVSNQPVTPTPVDLRHLGHRQGEAVSFDENGSIWVTSEAEDGGPPVWARLECRLGDSTMRR